MDVFNRENYVKADLTRGKIMIGSFFIAAFMGILSGLLPMGMSSIGFLLLIVVLFSGIFLVRRANYDIKKSSDYLIVFFITLFAFLGFWIISLNIP
jgi:ABC-type nickel/cobalt efflux system permease component RcnA